LKAGQKTHNNRDAMAVSPLCSMSNETNFAGRDDDAAGFGIGSASDAIRHYCQRPPTMIDPANLESGYTADDPTVDTFPTRVPSDEATETESWSVRRSGTKALVWGFDNLIAFGFGLYLPHLCLGTYVGLEGFPLWFSIGLISALAHQLQFTAGEFFRALYVGRETPRYHGDPELFSAKWWFNFLVLDSVACEGTGLVSGIFLNVLAVFMSFDTAPPVETQMFVLIILGVIWFASWALLEDACHIFLLKRSADFNQVHIDGNGNEICRLWHHAWSRSAKQLLALKPSLVLYNFCSVTLKTVSAVLAYWTAEQISLKVHGDLDLTDASYEVDVIVVVTFICCFFIPYVFLGMRVTGLILVV